MFPAPKRVAFKAPLTEDIKTEKYTLAHSDLASSSSSISTLNLPPPEHDTDRSSSNPGGEPHTGDKRDSSDEDSDVCPATPVAGRRKRRREWVWTLGPVGGKDAASSDDQPVQPAVVAEAAKQT
ncbi:hypothetical protein H2203_005687 [Taxawa tesnikishii (nom. ined.)]|nr:hypothetical protein H2203_005687 [Dothideales sp. JES 119]